MTRPAFLPAAVALSLIVGGLGASHAFGDLLGMFSRGLGATGWAIFALASCAYAAAFQRFPTIARSIVAAHRSIPA